MDELPDDELTIEAWAGAFLERGVRWTRVPSEALNPTGTWHHVTTFFDNESDRKIRLAIDGIWWPTEWPRFLQPLVFRWRKWRYRKMQYRGNK